MSNKISKYPKLLETIKCLDGSVYNLGYHQDRVNTSRERLGLTDPLKLELSPPEEGLFRCRIIYSDTIHSLQYLPYQIKQPSRFKLIETDISYSLKYEDRDAINALFNKKEEADEIIMIKNGLVMDSSIANLCFFDGEKWLTPKYPLLKGTTRQRYLDLAKIQEADINANEIQNYSKIALMNAMLDFYIIENAIIL